MTYFTVGLLSALIVVLLVERFMAEAAHRRERERLVRATMARHMPEFAALQRIIEPELDRPKRRLKAVGDDRDPEAPLVPEGL